MNLLRITICAGILGAYASAGVITADFNESLDLPFFKNTGPRVEQVLGVSLPSSGPQLTDANVISNPSNWTDNLNISFDATTNILTLNANHQNNYQIITVMLSNLIFDIPGQVVVGITPITLGSAVTPNANDTDPTVTTTPFFTSNSFGVTYTAANYKTSGNDFLIATDSDSFQVTLATVASPEPGTVSLMGFGIGAAVLAGWRKRKAA